MLQEHDEHEHLLEGLVSKLILLSLESLNTRLQREDILLVPCQVLLSLHKESLLQELCQLSEGILRQRSRPVHLHGLIRQVDHGHLEPVDRRDH